jgi:hypothetical protein
VEAAPTLLRAAVHVHLHYFSAASTTSLPASCSLNLPRKRSLSPLPPPAQALLPDALPLPPASSHASLRVQGDDDWSRGRKCGGGGRQPAVHTPLLIPGRTVVRSGASEPLTAAISGAPAARAPLSNSLDFGGAQEHVRHWTLPLQAPFPPSLNPLCCFLYSAPLAPPRHGHRGGDLLLSLLAFGWVVGDGTGRRARRRRRMEAARRRATACGCAATADGEGIFSRGF